METNITEEEKNRILKNLGTAKDNGRISERAYVKLSLALDDLQKGSISLERWKESVDLEIKKQDSLDDGTLQALINELATIYRQSKTLVFDKLEVIRLEKSLPSGVIPYLKDFVDKFVEGDKISVGIETDDKEKVWTQEMEIVTIEDYKKFVKKDYMFDLN